MTCVDAQSHPAVRDHTRHLPRTRDVEDRGSPRLARPVPVASAACAEYEEAEPDEFRSGPPVCSACQYKTATFTVTAADLSGGRLVSAIARTDVEHTGTCPYAGYSAPCIASSDFDVSCLITGPGTYSIGYSPNGLKTSGGSTAVDDTVFTIVGGTTKDVRKPLNLGNPTTIVQPTTFPCGGEVEIDIAD